ncbi:helix-turn-helix transcriptional regulator [Streptomyces noursei]|nr:helix-turn-helix transcriptional regulator [Streptomyces noursei]
MSSRELWGDGRLRAAWAANDWPAVFRRYRQLAGISQRRLGELVDMTQGYVSNVERGRHAITSAEVVARITEGLQVPVELGGWGATQRCGSGRRPWNYGSGSPTHTQPAVRTCGPPS